MRQLQVAILFFLSCLSLGINRIIETEPLKLKGTTWNGQYNAYNNFYHFKSNNKGVSEDGILASRCALDPSQLEEKGIFGNHYIYETPQKFKYIIQDTTLTIWYPNQIIDGKVHQSTFYYRKKHDDWISDHEYAYGFEVLKKGNKLVLMDLK